jgi:NADPH:quinone reductase-like Zn-dependent oxidoreductase
VLVHPIFTCRTCAACTSGDEFFCRKAKIWGFETGPYAGGYAELCAVPAASLLPKPPNLSWEEAATLPTIAITAWRMLVRRARVKRDDFVLVWGAAGGTGSMAVQIARHLGARVIGVASNEQRLEYVHELGAEFTIDRSRQDVAVEVARITNRRGVDLVVEHSGRDTWPRSVRSIRRGGALVVCGATSGYMAETDLRFLWNKQLTFYGSHGGSKADLYEVLARVKSGALSPARYDLLALKDGREAQRRLEQGAVVGKIVVAP